MRSNSSGRRRAGAVARPLWTSLANFGIAWPVCGIRRLRGSLAAVSVAPRDRERSPSAHAQPKTVEDRFTAPAPDRPSRSTPDDGRIAGSAPAPDPPDGRIAENPVRDLAQLGWRTASATMRSIRWINYPAQCASPTLTMMFCLVRRCRNEREWVTKERTKLRPQSRAPASQRRGNFEFLRSPRASQFSDYVKDQASRFFSLAACRSCSGQG